MVAFLIIGGALGNFTTSEQTIRYKGTVGGKGRGFAIAEPIGRHDGCGWDVCVTRVCYFLCRIHPVL